MKSETLKNRARLLRKNSTEAEQTIWFNLRNNRLGAKFKRQVPMGSYIVDFVCLDKRLIIEIDGGQHLENQEYDKKRTDYLGSIGFRVLRFWNNEVLQEISGVMESIYAHLNK